jgi:hypothetical protein
VCRAASDIFTNYELTARHAERRTPKMIADKDRIGWNSQFHTEKSLHPVRSGLVDLRTICRLGPYASSGTWRVPRHHYLRCRRISHAIAQIYMIAARRSPNKTII